MGNVSLTLLGGFAASVDGVPVAESAWRLKKARELVKLLSLAPGHQLHREQAMELLWGDRAPDAAANNLHQAVYVARRALDPQSIEVRDEMLELVADVDIDRFAIAAAAARDARTPRAYRDALALYLGELLPENRYDDWAGERRDEFAHLVAELEDELGALGPESAGPRRSLPSEASSFIGRERELGELKVLVHKARLLTLSGTGGAGKTRLALELARDAEALYPDGAVFVPLADLADATRLPDAVAAGLDVRAMSGQNPLDAVIEFLEPRSSLLVLDNCEHVLAATAAFANTLLRSAARLTILATSRESLRVPGEVVFRVPSLDIPDPERTIDVNELLRYEGVRLFVERAAAAAPDFELDEENAADVARICVRLDGLPLALELAAGRMAALGPATIAERLADRFRVLRTDSRVSPTRQHTLAATLQWSHDLLEPAERVLFRRLAVFAGGFDLGTVEHVCAGRHNDDIHDIDYIDAATIADLLGRLVEKSLVVADAGSSRERRYRLLETVRLYARERLDEAGEANELADVHARWALALAQAEHGSARLDCDGANLRSALRTLLERAPTEALRFCVALGPFWLRRIDLDEAHTRFGQALAAAPERTSLRAQALLAAAAIDYRSGALARSRAQMEDSYSLAYEIGDAQAQWRALQFLGEFGLALDAADVARPWLERALDLARREGFAAQHAICIHSLGIVYWILGDLALAEEHVAHSIELFDALAGSPERIPSPVNIVEIRRNQRRPGLRVVFQDSLQPLVEITCVAAAGYALANRASIARVRGDLVGARALLDESAARFAAAGDEKGVAAVLVRRAYVEFAEGALSSARSALGAALDLRRAHGDRRGVGLVLAGLGLIDTNAGDYGSAERHLSEAREIFRRAGDRWGLASTLWRTADLAFARGSLGDAEVALQEARSVLKATQRDRWIANTLTGLAEVALLRGDPAEAIRLLHDARDRYAARDDAVGVADVEQRLAEVSDAALGSTLVR
jgi:predicted ATPase